MSLPACSNRSTCPVNKRCYNFMCTPRCMATVPTMGRLAQYSPHGDCHVPCEQVLRLELCQEGWR